MKNMVGDKGHKQTAWKKNRNLGDKMGGRQRLKLKDNIFALEHSFAAPSEFEETPIFIVENASKNYYFPIGVDDIKAFLGQFPKEETDFITHIWLRSHRASKEKQRGHRSHKSWNNSIGEYISGSGVYLITLYPLTVDNKHYLGKNKPTGRSLHEYEKYAEVYEDKDGWYARFTDESSAKSYYLDELLPYCLAGLKKGTGKGKRCEDGA